MEKPEVHPESHEITHLLHAWRSGDEAARERLSLLVEGDLRRLARSRLRHERRGGTLQTGDLVNETWLRLAQVHHIEWQDRAHFYNFVAEQMQRVIVDLARRRCTRKRGAGERPKGLDELDESRVKPPEQALSFEDQLALREALKLLMKKDPRSCRVTMMRYYLGLTFEEIAEIEGLSLRAVKGDWSFARRWLKRKLETNRNREADDEPTAK